jgi:predicted RNase H-like nuclease
MCGEHVVLMSGVGVDWASGRWVTVSYDPDAGENRVSVGTAPSILNVWDEYSEADQILIDIPIGLPSADVDDDTVENGRRVCDARAREILPADRRGSVFTVPCRDAVYADTYDQATAVNDDVLGRGLSAQSWGIAPRIQEVDVFLQRNDEATEVITESHPEVCFAMLGSSDENGASKHSTDGEATRVDALDEYETALSERYEELRAQIDENTWGRRITLSRLDDVLDAMVLALTAAGETKTLPEQPHEDGVGLPMEMVVPNW